MGEKVKVRGEGEEKVKVEGEERNLTSLRGRDAPAPGIATVQRGQAVEIPLTTSNKFGLLRNGVQMMRFASGPTVTLLGKRERGPRERHGGRTDKVIYKVTVSRTEKTAAVDIDGVNRINLVGGRNEILEHGALAMLDFIISFNALRHRHQRARLKRRKDEADKKVKVEGEGVKKVKVKDKGEGRGRLARAE